MRSDDRVIALVLALGAALALSVPVSAEVTALTVNKCLARKLSGVGRSAAARTKCYAKDAASGVANPLCLQMASDRFTGDGNPSAGVFAKLEARYSNGSATPCLTFGDAASLDSAIASYAASVPAATGSTAGRCDGAKITCVGKYVKAVASCYTKAASVGGGVDAGCVARAGAKLANGTNGCLERAATRTDCTHAGSQAFVLRAAADIFLRNATCALDPTNPACACATTYVFTANGPDADLDNGWTGVNHGGDVPAVTRLTLAVSGCANAVTPCGTCALSGPLENAGGAAVANRRCRGDVSGANGSWLSCASDADCAGTGNACVLFFGPPRPEMFGIYNGCTLTAITGPASGTLDPDAGSVTLTLPVSARTYASTNVDAPCPVCAAGACSAGPRAGQPCTVQGHSPLYDDDVSLDCPPDPDLVTTQAAALAFTTGTQTLTLAAASPPCRASPGKQCFCDTCNSAGAQPCTSDASCPPSGGSPGICGGKRCQTGANVGAPCAANSECPGSACGIPGVATAPNQCDDGVCSSDLDPYDTGTCEAGPFDTFCAIQRYRGCRVDGDCPLAGDTCIGKFRECFPTSGVVGDVVRAIGVASPVAPTLATLYCSGPTTSPLVNIPRGLPGLVRLKIPGTATMN